METFVCPKGHPSSDPEYCSECGAKIKNGVAAGAPVAAADLDLCPDCGTKRENKGIAFCEICGYNFLTGARGEVPLEYATPPLLESLEPVKSPELLEVPEPMESETVVDAKPEAKEATKAAWSIEVSVNESLKQAESPDAPANFVAFTVELSEPVNLVGRTSQTRAIFPEIALDHDDAVSHRHALLQFDADGGLVVRDIGAANGTMLNGKEIEAMVDHPLKDGDEITLGHWSRITVKADA